jgi:hypothetical protein
VTSSAPAPPPVYSTLTKPTKAAASSVSSAPVASTFTKAGNGTAVKTTTASGPTGYTSPTPQAAKGDASKMTFGFAGLIAAVGAALLI